MQKIIKQELSGSLANAEQTAQYTWEKDEIAWYFCSTYNDVFKVKFTGAHWISGNKWSYEKIYEYEFLDKSSNERREKEGEVSHHEEDIFYSTKQEAIDRGIAIIKNAKAHYLKRFEDNMKRLIKFSKTTTE